MKKRVISLMLSGSLIIGLCGCNANMNSGATENAKQSAEESEEIDEANTTE